MSPGLLKTNDECQHGAWAAQADEIFSDAARVLPSGWTLGLAAEPTPLAREEQTLWSDDSDLLVVSRVDGRYLFSFEGFATFEIELSQKTCRIWPEAGATPDTLRHLVFDQILPRLIAHQGQLVLHAGALQTPAGAILFVGPSGRGKSTLVASFQGDATRVLGDDAVILTRRHGAIECEATYPSLRLYPDSLGAVFDAPPVTVSVAQYTTKRSVQGLSRLMNERSPVAAIFVLDKPGGDQVSVRRMRISDACMAFVEQSFSLNPTDTRCAQQRLHRASEAASTIPTFMLSFPRDFTRLPELRARVLDVVDSLDVVAGVGNA